MLTPEEIREIGAAVATAYGPYALAGVLLAIVAGVAIALKITAPEARRLTIAEIKDPLGELAKIRAAERAEILAAIDDKMKALPPFPDRLTDAQLDQIKLLIPPAPILPNFSEMQADFADLKASLSQENLSALISVAIANHEAAARARGGRGPAQTEQEQVIAVRMANDEEQARLYQTAMRWLQVLEQNPKVSGIRPATVKGWRKDVMAKFAEPGSNLMELLTGFGFKEGGAWTSLLPGGAQSAGAKVGGRGAGMP